RLRGSGSDRALLSAGSATGRAARPVPHPLPRGAEWPATSTVGGGSGGGPATSADRGQQGLTAISVVAAAHLLLRPRHRWSGRARLARVPFGLRGRSARCPAIGPAVPGAARRLRRRVLPAPRRCDRDGGGGRGPRRLRRDLLMLRARDSRLEAPVRSPGSRPRRTVVGRQQVLHSLLRGPRHLGGILPGELAGLDRIRDQLVHLGGEPGFAERAGEDLVPEGPHRAVVEEPL